MFQHGTCNFLRPLLSLRDTKIFRLCLLKGDFLAARRVYAFLCRAEHLLGGFVLMYGDGKRENFNCDL